LPQSLLSLGEQYLRQDVDFKYAMSKRKDGWVHCDDLSCQFYDEKNPRGCIGVTVGYAAVQALTVALQDEEYDPDHLDDSLSDGSKDPESLDTSYNASILAAKGSPQDPTSSVPARRRFWKWYLDEAIPAVL
jgi:Immunity protein Imm5